MFDEREFVKKLEAADPEQFVEMLRRPAADEEAALRAYAGDERYRRMHALALEGGMHPRRNAPRGNVVVLHGMMGAELTAYSEAKGALIWLDYFQLLQGRVERLTLDSTGREEVASGTMVLPTGILKKYYGEIIVSLTRNWKVRPFWYDWRKDLDLAAAELATRIASWFPSGAPVHLVAHSMGGLVARTFVLRHPGLWSSMDDSNGHRRGGRLIMLGTPNHGSFAIPQLLTGIEGLLRKLALFDIVHSRRELLNIIKTFPGCYQMMPSPRVMPHLSAFFLSSTWGDLDVPQSHLDAAKAHHDALWPVTDSERMVYVAGTNQPTYCDIRDPARAGQEDAYTVGRSGDGRVPHKLGLLDGVPAYYEEDTHDRLVCNEAILGTLDELLETGKSTGLSAKPTVATAVERGEDMEADRRRLHETSRMEQAELQVRLTRARSRKHDERRPALLTADERVAEDLLVRGYLPSGDIPETATPLHEPFEIPEIEIRLVQGAIQEAGSQAPWAKDLHVDAISVGHYVGVRPQAAELHLDRVISAALAGTPDHDARRRGVLDRLTERGTLRGELGEIFLLPYPRAKGDRSSRVLAVAGMGVPSRFGWPELVVLVRELVWMLSRLGKRHIATVLIGSGNGNLTIGQAVKAWVRGIADALADKTRDGSGSVRRITFVEFDPQRVTEIDEILRSEASTEEQIRLRYRPLTQEQRKQLANKVHARCLTEAEEKAQRIRTGRPGGNELQNEAQPTRLILMQEGDTYRFGAITAEASIPEREISLDPVLVAQANDELAAEHDLPMQCERGGLLGRLLLPQDLLGNLRTDAPLVLLLDSTTARIHWEMITQPRLALNPTGGGTIPEEDFLGTIWGVTRQLRTRFAPPPESPIPPRPILRVLVVADPAEDAHLPGAEEEGAAVARLFESFNTIHGGRTGSSVEVIRLFGPRDASRTNVLRHIFFRSIDVLHFAGHCVYDEKDRMRSGWLFSNGELLTARELNRIDRVPRFVFSNACQSGVTPDRSEKRAADLAPTFAEAFFARGVSNFVCTAWPVDDQASLFFAVSLYSKLLGIKDEGEDRFLPIEPTCMHEAMREARRAISHMPAGSRTWGAYQHYGNPYFRLFEVNPCGPEQESAPAGSGSKQAPAHPRRKRGRTR